MRWLNAWAAKPPTPRATITMWGGRVPVRAFNRGLIGHGIIIPPCACVRRVGGFAADAFSRRQYGRAAIFNRALNASAGNLPTLRASNTSVCNSRSTCVFAQYFSHEHPQPG